jgi:hypothetical protein
MTDCIFILYTLINTCRKVPLQVSVFRGRHFAFVSTYMVNQSMPWRHYLPPHPPHVSLFIVSTQVYGARMGKIYIIMCIPNRQNLLCSIRI